MELTVADLLKNPFLKRSLIIQQKIVAGGRDLIKFQDKKLYEFLLEKVHWIVRCEKKGKHFCWICLLYSFSYSMLEVGNNADIETVLDSAKKHELSEHHMEASLQLQLFIIENFPNSLLVADKTQHNLFVKRNLEILKRLIDAVCCVVALKHSRGDGKYTQNQITTEDCVGFLQLLGECDRTNIDLVEDAAIMMKIQPRMVNNLVDAITKVVKTTIKDETRQSAYVSLILSEHTGSLNLRSQVSIVLRYIKRGKVCERFVGFRNGHCGYNASTIDSFISNILGQYHIYDRFLGLSLDGQVLPSEELQKLIVNVRNEYPYSQFVPWYSHGFGNVLLQISSRFELVYCSCGSFLKLLQDMQTFFENPQHRLSLEISVVGKNPEFRVDKWFKSSPFIAFVAEYRSCFLEFFDNVVKSCKHWKADDITKAVSFRTFLQEMCTVILLHMFHKIFSNSFDENFNFLPEIGKEVFVFDNPRISAFKEHLRSLTFQSVWDGIVAEIEKEGPNSGLAVQVENASVEDFKFLFDLLLGHFFFELEMRCNCLSMLKFCDLLNCYSGGKHVSSSHPLLVMTAEHGPYFKQPDLHYEIAAFNANKVFDNKSAYEVLEYLTELNLRNVFPQLYKMAEFILSLPFLPASREKGISKFRVIDRCSYFPDMSVFPFGEASFLYIEAELLKEVKSSPLFYEYVFSKYYEVNKSLSLVHV